MCVCFLVRPWVGMQSQKAQVGGAAAAFEVCFGRALSVCRSVLSMACAGVCVCVCVCCRVGECCAVFCDTPLIGWLVGWLVGVSVGNDVYLD